MKKKNHATKFYFYILDDDNNEWVWNGHNFTEDHEEAQLYASTQPKEWVEKNFLSSSYAKSILKIYDGMSKDDLLVSCLG